jgi:hypothetical protein
VSDSRSGPGQARPGERPDPASFDPSRVGPIDFFIRVFDEMEHGTYEVEPSRVFRVTPPPAEASPGLLQRLIDRVLIGPKEWRDAMTRPKPLSFEQMRAALWGLVSGWCAAEEDAAARAASLERLLHTIEFSTRSELDFVAFGDRLRDVAPRGSGQDRGDDAARLLGPALPPRAVPRGAFAPDGYFDTHVEQLLLPISWDRAPPSTSLSDFASAEAPALDGLLACLLYNALVRTPGWEKGPGLVERIWAGNVGTRSHIFNGADQRRGEAFNLRFQLVTTSRRTPLTAPSTPTDVLHAALWANLAAKEYGEVLEAVTSLGGDTVATAAAAGGVAGAHFGYEAIPSQLKERVPDPARIEALARRLAQGSEA